MFAIARKEEEMLESSQLLATEYLTYFHSVSLYIWSATPFVFVSVSEFVYYIYSDHVETKEIIVKLLKIIQHTFRDTVSIISIASKLAEVD